MFLLRLCVEGCTRVVCVQEDCIRVPVTRRHPQARLEWAREHVRWTKQNWRPVLFTDESRFCLDIRDRRASVWRRAGEGLQDGNIAEHDRHGGRSVMVWGGISWDGRTDLVVLNRGTLTGQRYIDEMLETQVKASVTPEPNQLRIHPTFRIRVDSGAFCSPSANGRKIREGF